MAFFALLRLLPLLVLLSLASSAGASLTFKFQVNLERFDLFGNDLFFDPALPLENPYLNENVVFRELAGVIILERQGQAGYFDFSPFKLDKKIVDFNVKAPELNSFDSSTFPATLMSFPRSCMISNARVLEGKQRFLLEAVLIDLLRVIHPSLIGAPMNVDELLLLVVSHFVLNFDGGFYVFEFDSLKELFAHFQLLKPGNFALQALYDGWTDGWAEEVVVYSLESGNLFFLLWLLETGHFPWMELNHEQVKELVLMVFKQQEIDRATVLKRIIQVYGGSFVIYEDSKPWPLLWFVGIKAAQEAADFVGFELLSSLTAYSSSYLGSSFDWNILDEAGLTILGRWIEGEEIPHNLISKLLRAQFIKDNLAADGVSFVGAIATVAEETGKIELSKLRRFLTEVSKMNWPAAVKDAFESGKLWLFFSVFDYALDNLSEDFLRNQVLQPLANEVESPGILCEAFEKSHEALLAGPSKTSVFNYYSNWDRSIPSPPVESPKQSSQIFRSLSWTRTRSRSQSNKSPAVLITRNMASNVLSSVLSLIEARDLYPGLVDEFKI